MDMAASHINSDIGEWYLVLRQLQPEGKLTHSDYLAASVE